MLAREEERLSTAREDLKLMMFVSIVKTRVIGLMNVKTKRKREEEDLDLTQEENLNLIQEEDLDQDLAEDPVRAEVDHPVALAQEAAEAINLDLKALAKRTLENRVIK